MASRRIGKEAILLDEEVVVVAKNRMDDAFQTAMVILR